MFIDSLRMYRRESYRSMLKKYLTANERRVRWGEIDSNKVMAYASLLLSEKEAVVHGVS